MKAIVTLAKEHASELHKTARTRTEFAAAGQAYLDAIDAIQDGPVSQIEAGVLPQLIVLYSNAAESLLRAGDYTKARECAGNALDNVAMMPDAFHKSMKEKTENRRVSAEAGLRLLNGDLGKATTHAPIPDSWSTDPSADASAKILRLRWGWRSDLETAVRQSDAEAVEQLLLAHSFAEVNTFAECSLLLGKACSRGSLRIVELLVEEAGCDIDSHHGRSSRQFEQMDIVRASRGYNGCTPLYAAAQGEAGAPIDDRTAVANYLLERGADPMLESNGGPTPLFIACVNNALPIVQRMLDSGRCDVTRPIKDCETPLTVVRSCVADGSRGPEGFPEYRPMLELLEAAAVTQTQLPPKRQPLPKASPLSSSAADMSDVSMGFNPRQVDGEEADEDGGAASEEQQPGAGEKTAGTPIERAARKKAMANDAFLSGRYTDAERLYRAGVSILDDSGEAIHEPDVKVTDVSQFTGKSELNTLKVTLLSNRSEALLKSMHTSAGLDPSSFGCAAVLRTHASLADSESARLRRSESVLHGTRRMQARTEDRCGAR